MLNFGGKIKGQIVSAYEIDYWETLAEQQWPLVSLPGELDEVRHDEWVGDFLACQQNGDGLSSSDLSKWYVADIGHQTQ